MFQLLAIQDFLPPRDLPPLAEPWNTIGWVLLLILTTAGAYYVGFTCGRASAAVQALNNFRDEGTKDVTDAYLVEP